jgi:septum formation protein
MTKRKIILASTSPRRHELAQQMGLEFDIVPSDYEEDMTLNLSSKKLALLLSLGKAEDVAKKFSDGIVIGIDTFVVLKNKKLGKPKSKEDAFRMLKSLSGKWHEVHSGIAMIDCKTKRIIQDHELTKVKFRKLSDEDINKYIGTGRPMDKAGAYGIQDLSSIFVEKVDGCYFNVMGFPIHNVYKNLKKLGVDIFAYEGWQSR